jgi:hypothetical protein
MTPVAPGGASISAQIKPLGALPIPPGIKPTIDTDVRQLPRQPHRTHRNEVGQ